MTIEQRVDALEHTVRELFNMADELTNIREMLEYGFGKRELTDAEVAANEVRRVAWKAVQHAKADLLAAEAALARVELDD